MLTMDSTIAQWVAERMDRATIFERLGIDACCGGQQTLREACEKKGLDPQAVLSEIAGTSTQAPAGSEDWSAAPVPALLDHLLSTHHVYLKETMQPLMPLMEKVLRVHGPLHPELAELAEVYRRFVADMEQHLHKEEQILFPIIRQITEGGGPQAEQMRQFVPQPIRVMLMDHDTADRDLTRMRELTNDFTPPEGACGSYQRLLATLAAIDADTREHMQKENAILFPKFAPQEASALR